MGLCSDNILLSPGIQARSYVGLACGLVTAFTSVTQIPQPTHNCLIIARFMDSFTVLYSKCLGVSGYTYGTESRNNTKDVTKETLIHF